MMKGSSNEIFCENQLISKLLCYSETFDEQKDIYNNLRVFYEYLNWNELREENEKYISLDCYTFDEEGTEVIADVDCESLNVRKYNLQGNFLSIDDMIFKKYYKPIKGKLYGLFRFITVYEVLEENNNIKLNRVFSREIVNDGEIVSEKPIICYGQNFTNIECFEEENGIRKVLTNKRK